MTTSPGASILIPARAAVTVIPFDSRAASLEPSREAAYGLHTTSRMFIRPANWNKP